MSIHEGLLKIKGILKNDKTFIVLLICFVGVTSFGLGRLSANQSKKEPVVIRKTIENSIDSMRQIASDGEVVASKNGSKYHFSWCPGAKSITSDNKIVFKTVEDAKSAGYEPALNCPGLE